MRKVLAATLLLLALQPIVQAKPKLTDTVKPFLQIKPQPSFPDTSANYQNTVVIPTQQAADALIEASVVVYTPPPVQHPSLSTNALKSFIYNSESGNNPGAINASSGACGLGQALPCSKMPCSLNDYNCQDNFFTQYMLGRYGSWYNAYVFWLNNRWW